ncbi:MAG: sigma-70 family RNA polymerase sigma factor [Eubacteriales bacterium]|nr:sigma-70 family RNA polymerase sigma factor [Eubacteriales bacterium]
MSNSYDTMKDEELIRLLREGQSDIADYLMEKYKYLVRKKSRAMFLIGGENDDLIQEGMIGLFKAVRDFRFDMEASFQTFANLCIERQIYTAIKRQNRERNTPLNTYIPLEEATKDNGAEGFGMENPETILIDRENESVLRDRILNALSPMEKKVLLSYMNGSSYMQIAQELGKTPKAIDNAIQRIRMKAKNFIY